MPCYLSQTTYSKFLYYKEIRSFNPNKGGKEMKDTSNPDDFIINVGNGVDITPHYPLEIHWEPKEDITTYEFARAMPLLIQMNFRYIMPDQVELNEPYMRHFRIIDHNKEEKK
jgi:hypothetical protein